MMDLTIIVCVYNAAAYISDTLRDIEAQTFRQFKLLLIDDCSTDNTVELIEEFCNKSSLPAELIKLSVNKGIANARNYGLNHSTTKYVLFIDGDDRLSPFIVEKLYGETINDSNIMAVTCWSQFIDMHGKKIAGGTFLGVRSKDEFNQKAAGGKLFFMPIHTLFNRQIALSVGGFNTFGFPDGRPRYQDFCEELDLWTRMSDKYVDGKYFTTVPEVLYYYRKNNGLSSNHFNMILKMRYTKHNVRRRRKGMKDETFSEYYSSLSPAELKDMKTEAFAADSLRNGVILLKGGNPIKGGWLIMRSILARPSYFFDKLKHNL